MAEIKRLLDTSRLVVLTGAGGSGKPRLALQVAGGLVKSYRDGEWLVELASIDDPKGAADAIAHVLQVKPDADNPTEEVLKRFLARKHILLVLDNFEHLLEAAPMVGELLAAAPQLTVLATSREPLNIYGEQEFQVQPLDLPDLKYRETPKQLFGYDAVQLFAQRAQAVHPGFMLNDSHASAVAQMCVRLDGLPLAIELVAARMRLFNPQQLLDRLESRLSVLTGGARDVLARQRTLRDTIDWSYNLLDGSEKRLFVRLSAFNGGSSLDAVEAVCGFDLDIGALDGLESLLSKNLLYRTKESGGEPCFFMLETIHEYSRERLAESGEGQIIRSRHLDYYLGLVDGAEPRLEGPEHVIWLDQLEIEHANLLAALDWSLLSKDTAELGLRLAGSLALFWQFRGYFSEGRDYLVSALSRNEASKRTEARAKALYEAGRLSYVLGDFLVSRAFLNESLSIYRELGPDVQLSFAHGLLMLGDTETGVGNYSAASSSIKEGLKIMRALKGIARALWKLGWCLGRQGEYEQASQYFNEALPVYRQIGNKDGLSMVLAGLGETTLRQGDLVHATELSSPQYFTRSFSGIAIAFRVKNVLYFSLK